LQAADIMLLIERALTDRELGLGALELRMSKEDQAQLAAMVDGDARRALMLLRLI